MRSNELGCWLSLAFQVYCEWSGLSMDGPILSKFLVFPSIFGSTISRYLQVKMIAVDCFCLWVKTPDHFDNFSIYLDTSNKASCIVVGSWSDRGEVGGECAIRSGPLGLTAAHRMISPHVAFSTSAEHSNYASSLNWGDLVWFVKLLMNPQGSRTISQKNTGQGTAMLSLRVWNFLELCDFSKFSRPTLHWGHERDSAL